MGKSNQILSSKTFTLQIKLQRFGTKRKTREKYFKLSITRKVLTYLVLT